MKHHNRSYRSEQNYSNATNRHHTQWERRQFDRVSILNKLRNHAGMIITMNLFDHRALHSDLLPTPQPSKQLAEELLDHLGNYDDQSERTDYLDMAIDFTAETNPRYAQHLRVQRGYVLLHPFTRNEFDIVEMELVARNQESLGGVMI